MQCQWVWLDLQWHSLSAMLECLGSAALSHHVTVSCCLCSADEFNSMYVCVQQLLFIMHTIASHACTVHVRTDISCGWWVEVLRTMHAYNNDPPSAVSRYTALRWSINNHVCVWAYFAEFTYRNLFIADMSATSAVATFTLPKSLQQAFYLRPHAFQNDYLS